MLPCKVDWVEDVAAYYRDDDMVGFERSITYNIPEFLMSCRPDSPLKN